MIALGSFGVGHDRAKRILSVFEKHNANAPRAGLETVILIGLFCKFY